MFTGKAMITTNSEKETERVGEILGKAIAEPVVVALAGELGAGKTVFVRGAIRGLGYRGIVRSPTFTLCHVYQGRLPIYHFDFYRLADGCELHILDLEEYLYNGDGVVFIEWAEKFADELPPGRLEIFINRVGWRDGDETREIILVPGNEAGSEAVGFLLENLSFQ